MRTDAAGVVEGFYQAILAHDQAAQMAYIADDALFTQNAFEGTMPYAGTTIGKGQMAERLAEVYATWEMVMLVPLALSGDGDSVHCQMKILARYRRTGEEFQGRVRHVFRVVDGRIVRFDEYLDAPLLQAFLRLNAGHTRAGAEQAR